MTTNPENRTLRSMSAARRVALYVNLLALAFVAFASPRSFAQEPASIPEEIEWTWEVRPQHPDPQLPNVLLLGDSIARNYFPQVTKDLAGIANVYLMASSTLLGDPRLAAQIAEFGVLGDVSFRVLHCNNGMHGWGYTEAQYKAAFPSFLRAVDSLTDKNGSLIWASTTPVRPDATNGATNPRVDERNTIALAFVKAAGIQLDDQHALMMQHQDLYEDSIHFNHAGAKIQGDQAAAIIRSALGIGPQH
jgi:hypothetical protein